MTDSDDSGNADDITEFNVEFTDTGQADADAAYLWHSRRSPDYAIKWYAGLLRAAESLSIFPHRCTVIPESDRFPGILVRQLLYGRGHNTYRILFFLVDTDGDGSEDTVRIFRVKHGARRFSDSDDPS